MSLFFRMTRFSYHPRQIHIRSKLGPPRLVQMSLNECPGTSELHPRGENVASHRPLEFATSMSRGEETDGP